MITAAVAGLLTGLSLIVAIGAQNAFVLRQGLVRVHVGPVVAICAVSDLLLIAAGVAGLGSIIEHAGWLIDVVRWFGVAFLTWYAVTSLRRSTRPTSLAAEIADVGSRRATVSTTVALTWFNPHVYLDTLLLLGAVAATHGHTGRWWFGAGAGLGSVVWFTALGYGARLLSPVLERPRSWQVLDVLIGLVMLAVAIRLAVG